MPKIMTGNDVNRSAYVDKLSWSIAIVPEKPEKKAYLGERSKKDNLGERRKN